MVGILGSLPITVSGAGLLGTSAGTTGAAGILNSADDGAGALFGNIGSTTNSLMTQIRATAESRLETIQKQIQDVAKQRNDAIDTQNNRWISVKAQANNAQIAVTNGQEAIARVNNTLLNMRSTVANIGVQGEDDDFWRSTFDSQVNSINIEADSSGPASNLIGNINPVDYSPNQIEYRNNLGAGSTTLTGTYIGNAYRIEADDGTVWQPDLSTDILTARKGLQGPAQKYTTDDGQEIDKATSTRNGMKLLSYNQSTGRITLEITIVPEDGPITVTGTLKRAGVSLMQSWFYNGLATPADRKRARDDIGRTEVDLVSASATLQTTAVQTSTDQKHIDTALQELTQQTLKVRSDQQKQIQDSQIKAAQEYHSMQANLQNLQSVQSNYLQAFSGFVDDPFTQVSLNLIA